MSIYHKGS